MNRLIIVALLALCAAPLQAADKPLTEEQKTLYVVGTNVARSLSVFSLTPAEFDVVLQGLNDARAGKKADFDVTTYNQKMQDLARERRKASGEKQAAAGKEYLEKAAKEKNAVKTTTGMLYIPLTEGKGDSPKPADGVKVNYRGTLIDGSEFDSSYKRNKPLEFKLNNVITCWTEGLQKMKPGGKARLVCPPNLAYGDNGAGDMILPGATLSFEVELLEVTPPAPAAKPGSATPAKPAEPAKK
jgi:FKBP-type peptidyl-prolyl cis-trans isomerase FkpA